MSYFAHVSRYFIPATWQRFRELPCPALSQKATPHLHKLIFQVCYYYSFFFGPLVCALFIKQLTKSKSTFLFLRNLSDTAQISTEISVRDVYIPSYSTCVPSEFSPRAEPKAPQRPFIACCSCKQGLCYTDASLKVYLILIPLNYGTDFTVEVGTDITICRTFISNLL